MDPGTIVAVAAAGIAAVALLCRIVLGEWNLRSALAKRNQRQRRRGPAVPLPDAPQPQPFPAAAPTSITGHEMTDLDFVYEPKAPYQVHDRGIKFRIGVHNSGANPAKNVRVRLEAVEPPPHEPVFRDDFPYQVPRMGQTSLDPNGCQISPGETEHFEAIETWVSGEGVQIVYGLDTRPDAHPLHDKLRIDPEERWLLRYRLSSDNAEPEGATFTVQFHDGILRFYREDRPINA